MLVAFAIVFPVVFLAIIGGLDVSMAMLTAQNLQFNVEAAAWCAGTNDQNCTDAGSTLQYVATNTGLPTTNFTVLWTAGCGRLVSTNYTYKGFVIPPIRYSFLSCYPCRAGGC